MAIREDLVASAAKFLQDPSVASYPIEKKIAFLQAKNLTQEEVSAALARVGTDPNTPQSYTAPPTAAGSQVVQAPQPYYAQYPPQYPGYAWPQPPPEVPKRDWRDWFIMATVVGGVSYGLLTLGKRYIYPLVAPPTPDRLETDKKSIDEQFDKTFALVEQLAKDTEALKAAEQERTERLDTALGELETVINDLKSANRRRDDEAQRVRDDVQNLKESIPRAMNNQKDLTDNRLREVNAELKSLKTLIAQRMNPTATSTSVSSYLRPTGSATGTPSSPATTPLAAEPASNGTNAPAVAEEPRRPEFQGASSLNRSSPFSSSMGPRASIPSWQMAASTKTNGGSSSSTKAATVTEEEAVNGDGDAQSALAN
ncbi:peroxisomal membrane protein PER10 [Rhypophila decipiens]|uniref:Peroxisomal membrane protein PEX14 n=1 Tax=Rhypophila decipiens TaxID=261697 RepID=A0AAN6YK36_9PEZI|nr:peroxisomal membrane protein PER10 [Rhypophila decipiens]